MSCRPRSRVTACGDDLLACSSAPPGWHDDRSRRRPFPLPRAPDRGDLDQVLAHLRSGQRLLDRPEAAGLQARVRDVAARLSWLADRFPEVVEAEINPLVVTADSAVAIDVRIRIAPRGAIDPMVRELPS